MVVRWTDPTTAYQRYDLEIAYLPTYGLICQQQWEAVSSLSIINMH